MVETVTSPSRQRAIEPAIALLERGEEPVVEDEPRAGHPREHAAHDVAGRASAAREHDGQRLIGPERPLEHALVVFDEDAAHDVDAGSAERRRDRRAVGAGGRHRPDRDDVGARCHGQAKTARPMTIPLRAYHPAIRSSTMIPMPPGASWLERAGNGLVTSKILNR